MTQRQYRHLVTAACFVVGTTLCLAVVVCLQVLNAERGRDREGFSYSPPSPADQKAAVASGRPVVEAIYRYRSEVGLWPCELADLVPRYLTTEAIQGWAYGWHANGYWT